MYELLLVSQSPRRRELLEDAGFSFRVDTVEISEIIEENINLRTAVAQVAYAKVWAYWLSHNYLKSKEILLLSADTIVTLGGQVLGKPKSSTQAMQFLRLLSGKMHSVITGIAILNAQNEEIFQASDQTEVQFRDLTEQEITDYVATGEPMDKAGAYGIQGLGRALVQNFNGSLSNVIGLPLELLEKSLAEKGWHVARRNHPKKY
jgi:septum formation protein